MLHHLINTKTRREWSTRILALTCALWLPTVLLAQTAPAYKTPPKPLVDLVDARPTPGVEIDPSNTWLLLLERPNLASIEELSQPELRIAGLRINPRINARSRRSYYTGLKLKKISGGEAIAITGIPQNARIRNVDWSADGKHIAFVNADRYGQSLWVAELSSKKARKLSSHKLNSVYGAPFEWTSDNRTLICKVVPADRGEAPAEPTVPTGPTIQETTGRKAPARTYQDLLQNSHDEALFEYYSQTEVHRITLDGQSTRLGKAGLVRRAEPSPDGNYLLVETMQRPFSYIVPFRRFPYIVEVWDANGNLVNQIADLPLAEEIPIGFGAVPTGRRSFGWRDDADATLCWTEAQDGGDPRSTAEVRDKISTLDSPFDGSPKEMISLGIRYGGIDWGNDKLALVYGWWWQNRKQQVWTISPAASDTQPTLLFDYSWQDRYNDPGSPLTHANKMGRRVLLTSKNGNKLYLRGAGASPEGDRPFFDELDVASKKTKRLWRSEAPYYESATVLLNASKLQLLTRRESKTDQPNFYVRDLKKNKITQITDFPHPTPQLANVQKEMIRYERDDGVTLTATLYLPAAYKPEDGPLPMVMWAYPREFKSADAAAQVTGSPHRFVRVSVWGATVWLAMGYAVLDGPTMPIIGEGEAEPNDTYVKQLVASAKAAVDEVVRRGVAERGRIAIGGHSYGAFMTANLLAHSDLFSAGIARSGAYNRSLTPFGFQAEERTFWEAPEVYFKMSPFMHAEKINEPILLIHGEADNNSGTFPIQSKRYYHALKGHGAKARLVMLPFESHGYRARESILHMLWETNNWLEKYVKNAETPAEPTETSGTSMP